MDHSNDTSYSKSRRSHEITESLKSISRELSKFDDSAEDFQFKPLTSGLGFQKKSLQTESALQHAVMQISTQPEIAKLEIHEALTPAKIPTQIPSTPKQNKTEPGTSEKVETILKNLRDRRLNFEETLKFPQPPPKTTVKNKESVFFQSSFDFSAGLLDSMLVLSLCLTALISLIFVTGADLFQSLMNPDPQGAVYIALAAVIVGFSFIYLMATRAFLGSSLGEWIFDQQLGTQDDQVSASYTYKVALRSLVVIATGFVLLPILSIIMNRDLPGQITGLRLIKKS